MERKIQINGKRRGQNIEKKSTVSTRVAYKGDERREEKKRKNRSKSKKEAQEKRKDRKKERNIVHEVSLDPYKKKEYKENKSNSKRDGNEVLD